MFTFALDLMDILLDDAVGEAKVYNLEDPVLAGPEHIGRLQVSMYNALDKVLTLQICVQRCEYHLAMETVQSNKKVLSEPEAGPG